MGILKCQELYQVSIYLNDKTKITGIYNDKRIMRNELLRLIKNKVATKIVLHWKNSSKHNNEVSLQEIQAYLYPGNNHDFVIEEVLDHAIFCGGALMFEYKK